MAKKKLPRARPPARTTIGSTRLPDETVGPIKVLHRPQAVPSSLAGKYVAWSPDGLRILGYGSTLADARIDAGGRPGLLIQRIPSSQRVRAAKNALEHEEGGSPAKMSGGVEVEAAKS